MEAIISPPFEDILPFRGAEGNGEGEGYGMSLQNADIRALIGFAQLLAREQIKKYVTDDRERDGISQDDEVCANCQKFHQHYVINATGAFIPIRHGHCNPSGRGFEHVGWKDNCKHFEARWSMADASTTTTGE